MRKLTLSPAVLFVVLFFVSNVFGQEKEEERKFSFSFQTGLTLHTDYLVNDDYSWNGVGINYFEGGLFYKLSRHVEVGATIGRDKFKVSGLKETPEPIPGFINYAALNPYAWFAGNINYYFNKKYSAGVKVGAEQYAYHIAGNVGINLLSSKDWGLFNVIQLSTRIAKSNSYITYQLNILFNVRFKPDLTGIF